VFLELYYGIPNESSADKFCYSFDEAKHVGDTQFSDMHPLYLSFDFNYNPICCGVIQNIDGAILVHELIKLENSNIYNLCDLISIKYPGCHYIVTGDATGKNNSALVKDSMNYYRVIKEKLNVPDTQMKVPSVNPRMEENQVLVNAIFEHGNVIFNEDKAQPLIFDCKFVQMDNNKKIVKTDRNDPAQQADALDVFRYYCHNFHKDFVKMPIV